jgi:hypothetical protein
MPAAGVGLKASLPPLSQRARQEWGTLGVGGVRGRLGNESKGGPPARLSLSASFSFGREPVESRSLAT